MSIHARNPAFKRRPQVRKEYAMKAKTSITMDVETLAKAREHDINVSATAEQAVSERLEEKSMKAAGVSSSEPDNDTSNNGNSVEDES